MQRKGQDYISLAWKNKPLRKSNPDTNLWPARNRLSSLESWQINRFIAILQSMTLANESSRDQAEQTVKAVLGWLALAHGNAGPADIDALTGHLLTLRQAPVPPAQNIKLLDLLYTQATKVVEAELPELHRAHLPISRKTRQLVRGLHIMLETLAQNYSNTLAELFDPLAKAQSHVPNGTLWRILDCLALHLNIGYLAASPAPQGIWQRMHGALRTARLLGITDYRPAAGKKSTIELYLSSLLVACAQPASFTSAEQEFIGSYLGNHLAGLELSDDAPQRRDGIFWIDLERDVPATPLLRRPPPPDTHVLYFCCDQVAQQVQADLAALKKKQTAEQLGLPPFADTAAGQGVLRRIATFLGAPTKRRFPRRRQSYRVFMCNGLEQLHQALATPEHLPPEASEWMITNESPDGYAMMHVAGKTSDLQVGDVVAVRPQESGTGTRDWQVCIIRWALSENPEHIELGVQMLAPRAIPAQIAIPAGPLGKSQIDAVLLPEVPPLRPNPALITATGTIADSSRKIILLVQQGNLNVSEIRPLQLDEQTARVEVYSVRPDEMP